MRPLRTLLLLPVGLAILLAAAWLLYSPHLANQIRDRLRETLTAELDTPVRLDAVELGLLPPALTLRGLAVGPDGELLHLGLLRARVLPLRSLRRFFVVGQATVEDLQLDVPKVSGILAAWASGRDATEPSAALPVILLENIQCSRIRVRLSQRDAPLELSIAQLLGELRITGGSRVSHLQLRGSDIDLRRSNESLELSEVRLGMVDRGRGLVLQSLDIQGDGFGVSTPSPSTDGKTRLRLNADPSVLSLLGIDLADWQGDLSAQVVIDGPVTDGSVTASAKIQNLAFAGKRLTALEASLGWQDDTIELRIDQGDTNSIRLDANLADDDELQGRFEVSWSELDSLPGWFGWSSDVELHGSAGAVGSLDGTLERPHIQGRAWVSPLSLFGRQVGGIEAELSLDRERLTSNAIEVIWQGGGLSASGSTTFGTNGSNEWRAEIRSLPLDDGRLLAASIFGIDVPVSGGSVDATVALDGAWPQLAIRGQAQAVNFRLLGESFPRLRIGVTAELPEWGFDAQLSRGAEEVLSVVGSGGEDGDLRLTLDGTDWDLQGFGATAASGMAGLVSLRGQLGGQAGALSGTLVAEAENLTWNGRSLGQGRLQADAADGAWQFGADLLQGAVRLDGSFAAARRSRFDLRASWTDVDFAVLLSDDPSLRVLSSGSFDLGGDPGKPLEIGGEMRLESLLVANGQIQASTSEPIRMRGQDGQFTIDPFTLTGEGERIRVFGSFGLDGSFNATAAGGGSLQLFEILGGPLRSADGQWQAQIVAERRPPDGLVLRGSAAVASAAFDFGLPVGPSRTTGRFRLAGTEVIVEELSGRLGGGKFAIEGSVDLQRGPHLTWQFEEVNTGLLSPAEDEVSGKGIVGGSWDDITIAGDLAILRMLYEQRVEMLDFLPSLRPALAAAPPSDLAQVPIHLDLRITAPGEIFLDNNFARIEAKADLQVTGPLHDIRVSGPIDLLTGEIFFRGRTFEVTTGLIEFRRDLGMNPYLNIVAESEIDTSEELYTVTIEVLGTADDYSVTMSADGGSVTQTDVLSLIVFGKTTAQRQREEGGINAGALVALVPGKYAESAQKTAASLLRLDRVEFEPAFSRTTGRFEPELTVGKNVTEDLTATLGATFGLEGRQTVSLVYSLTPEISLLGSWESQSVSQEAAFGAGAQLRRQFRNFPGFSLLGSNKAEDLPASEEMNEE